MALTIEQLNHHIRLCVQTKADGDYDRLYDALFGRQLFLNITLGADGKGHQMGYSDIQGIRVVTFFTTANLRYLHAPYGSMGWNEIITMLAKTSDVGGCQIYNDTDDWVIFGTPYLLQRLPNPAQA